MGCGASSPSGAPVIDAPTGSRRRKQRDATQPAAGEATANAPADNSAGAGESRPKPFRLPSTLLYRNHPHVLAARANIAGSASGNHHHNYSGRAAPSGVQLTTPLFGAFRLSTAVLAGQPSARPSPASIRDYVDGCKRPPPCPLLPPLQPTQPAHTLCA